MSRLDYPLKTYDCCKISIVMLCKKKYIILSNTHEILMRELIFSQENKPALHCYILPLYCITALTLQPFEIIR